MVGFFILLDMIGKNFFFRWNLEKLLHINWELNLSCLSLRWAGKLIHTLTVTPSGLLAVLLVFFMSIKALHILNMQHNIYILRQHLNFIKLCEIKNGGVAFRSRSQSKWRSWLGLEAYQEASLSTRAQSNWFGLLWNACVLTSPNKPNKGRNCSRV